MVDKLELVHDKEKNTFVVNTYLDDTDEAVFLILHAIDAYFSGVIKDKNRLIPQLLNNILKKHGFHVIKIENDK